MEADCSMSKIQRTRTTKRESQHELSPRRGCAKERQMKARHMEMATPAAMHPKRIAVPKASAVTLAKNHRDRDRPKGEGRRMPKKTMVVKQKAHRQRKSKGTRKSQAGSAG